MGEVYRARDTKLGRNVALKILPSEFTHDPDRIARFKREAQVLASLNHPHIAAIYGLEEANDSQFLVLELVEGDTLAQRIARGPIPVEEALAIARQIAEALEAAHEKAIIHRDLKPSNIAFTAGDQVKVLDFGLAKALDDGSASGRLPPERTASPTITTPAMMTGVGMILGTTAYMSPEQAKGRAADKRSDVWAFGCVLYEMFTGHRAFEGEDVSDTLAAVLRSEPDWSTLPTAVPPAIRVLLQRCLQKDRRQRVAEVSTALFLLNESERLHAPDPAGPSSVAIGASVSRHAMWRRVAIGSTITLVVGSAVTGALVWFSMRPSAPPLVRFSITPSGTAAVALTNNTREVAITLDGTRIVYGGNGGALFVRALDQLEPTPLTGLGIARDPFISPNGEWVGFFDLRAALKKVAITGGPAVTLCRVTGQPRGATWGPDGTIIFSTDAIGGLQRVSAEGGEPTVLTRISRERGESGHLWPEFLPGGSAVLFTITSMTGGIENAQVAVIDLRTGTQKILVRDGSNAHYVPSGHLVYAAEGTLRAVAFDINRVETTGPAIPVLPRVVTKTNTGGADFAVARNGTLVYVPSDGRGSLGERRTLVWVDRQGHEEPIKAPARSYISARISPDDTRVALGVADQDGDIHIWDLVRGTLTRLTFGPRQDLSPVWTPDGHRIVFASDRAGVFNLFWRAADGTGAEERLTESPNPQRPSAISPGAEPQVIFDENTSNGFDIMALTLDKDRRVQPLVKTRLTVRNGEVSPDGHWLAYESAESGPRLEIYVRPFPDVNSGHWQVSAEGGRQPVWGRKGQELVYVALSGALMSVPLEHAPAWKAGPPTKLFENAFAWSLPGTAIRSYDVSHDGRRFLALKPVGGSEQPADAPTSLIVVEHWDQELKRLVPTK
jgi:serine/threonine protein kinase/WD40 repeat protein